MRWDYSCEDPHCDARGFRVKELLQDTDEANYFAQDAQRTLTFSEIKSDLVLRNGARFYNDHAHPEYCTPECNTLQELLQQDYAGDALLIACAKNLAQISDNGVLLYKNNTDYRGHSYGCHENYLMPRTLTWDVLSQAIDRERMNNRSSGRFRVGETEFACRIAAYNIRNILRYNYLQHDSHLRQPCQPVQGRINFREILEPFFFTNCAIRAGLGGWGRIYTWNTVLAARDFNRCGFSCKMSLSQQGWERQDRTEYQGMNIGLRGETMETNTPAWYCIRSLQKNEHIAAGNLRQLEGVEVFSPQLRVQRPTRRGPVWFCEPLFPSYVFAKFLLAAKLDEVRYTAGVNYVVNFGGRWPTVSEWEMEELRRNLGGGECCDRSPKRFRTRRRSWAGSILRTPPAERIAPWAAISPPMRAGRAV